MKTSIIDFFKFVFNGKNVYRFLFITLIIWALITSILNISFGYIDGKFYFKYDKLDAKIEYKKD